MSQTIVIASILRPEGETGVQTHFQAFIAYLKEINRHHLLVTPFNAPHWQVYPIFSLRKIIELFSTTASVWWYRYWHEYFLECALRKFFKDSKDCVVYVHCPISARAALNARVSDAQKIVMAVHFYVSQADEWAWKGMISKGGRLYRAIQALEADVLPRLDGLVFVSEFLHKELLLRIPAVGNVPYALIPNFVRDPGIDQAQIKDGELISIGALEPHKNQAYQLDIIAAARRQGFNLHLTLVGGGPDRTILESKAQELGIADVVTFTGFVGNAAQLLGRHRVFIHTARIENMPFVLVEALSRGLPVYAPAVGGIPEIFENGVEGRIIPLDEPEVAARLIMEWMESPEILIEAGKAARVRFLRNFQTSVASRKLTGFLDGIAKIEHG